MLKVLAIIVLSVLISATSAGNDCAEISTQYFQWLNADGSLVIPTSYNGVNYETVDNDTCCGPNCTEHWQPLDSSPSCQFCNSTNSLICRGSDVYEVPDPASLPSTNLSLFKMSGVGLIGLPPKCFSKLSIQRLIIEDSNLKYIDNKAFEGVKSVNSIHLNNNTHLNYLSQAGLVFENAKNLIALNLDSNGLRVVSSATSANVHSLEYFSLAGNPLYNMDVLFLQNSSLKLLDFQRATFKLKPVYLDGSGFDSLPNTLNTLDFSRATVPVKVIEKILTLLSKKNITTLSLAHLGSSVGLLNSLRPIRHTIKYLSFEGTDMNSIFPPDPKTKKYFDANPFIALRELNMRNCSLEKIGPGDIFNDFPNLSGLILSQNRFSELDLQIFFNLPSLSYLDLSNNFINELSTVDHSVSNNLQILDLSFVDFDAPSDQSQEFFNIMPYLKKLSFCGAFITSFQVCALQSLIYLEWLDLSKTLPNTPDLTTSYHDLFAMKNSSLIELYFEGNNFKFQDTHLFSSLTNLKHLDLSNNVIRDISPNMFGSALECLKLSQNLVTTWYSPILTSSCKLKTLDLSNNQITFVSNAMVHDFHALSTLDLTSNQLICQNKVVAMICSNVKNKTHNLTMENWQQYQCYDTISNSYRLFSEPQLCDEYFEEYSTLTSGKQDIITLVTAPTPPHPPTPPKHPSTHVWNWEWTYLIILPIVLIATLTSIVYLKWWNIRCFVHRYFNLRKARLIKKNGDSLIKPDIQYDVFVSYSDVDRSWVLDYLIPNMETGGDISLCFHERDFQVGMSIMENIIDCMDRSQSLLLVVSSGFVRSKWCQFEMHLAQYRLIETLRDQLVLVLLEDIPRKSRPQTLHHMMMTKTYLVWPQQPCSDSETELFWKRLKRALRQSNNNYIFDV